MADSFYHGVSIKINEEGGRVVQSVSTSIIGIVGTTEQDNVGGIALTDENGVFIVCSDSEQAKAMLRSSFTEMSSSRPQDEPTPVEPAGGPKSKNRRPHGPMTENLGSNSLETFQKDSAWYSLNAIFDQTKAIVVCYVVKTKKASGDSSKIDVDATMKAVKDAVAKLESAEAETGYKPKILLAPGFSENDTSHSIAMELNKIARKLKGISVYDLNTGVVGSNNAINKPNIEVSDRLYPVFPNVLVPGENPKELREEPLSPRAAGAIARSDNERGWWCSPSNIEVYGVVKTRVAVPFVFGDETCLANKLNENCITTLIRQDGWRLWGNRTAKEKNDPYTFLVVRRTADVISESVLRSHLWAVDRNITKTYIEEVVESNNAYLRSLRTIGAILGGKCWVEPANNPKEDIKNGKVVFDFDFTPNYPAENVHFSAHMVDDYIKEIFK